LKRAFGFPIAQLARTPGRHDPFEGTTSPPTTLTRFPSIVYVATVRSSCAAYQVLDEVEFIFSSAATQGLLDE
jgi:hypothetical protein